MVQPWNRIPSLDVGSKSVCGVDFVLGVDWKMQNKVQASLSVLGAVVCELVKVPFATGLFLEVLQRAWAFPFWGAQGQAFPAAKQQPQMM